MKKTKVIKVSPEADVGLRQLRSDAGKLYKWGAKKYTKKVLGSGKRPKGVPKIKRYAGHPYKFYGIFASKLDASEMSNMIRHHGSYARTQSHSKGWIVWEGEKY